MHAACCLQFTPLYGGMGPFFPGTSPPLGGGYTDPVSAQACLDRHATVAVVICSANHHV